MQEFNLLATHLPGYYARRRAVEELGEAVGSLRVVWRWQNIIYAWVPDPRGAVRRAASSLPGNTVVLRVIPVDAVVEPVIGEIRRVVRGLLERAPPGSFAVRVDGHPVDESGRMMHRRDAAIALAEGVDRPVNLSAPDVLVYVKILRYRRGYKAAVYVGPPGGILSTVKRGVEH